MKIQKELQRRTHSNLFRVERGPDLKDTHLLSNLNDYVVQEDQGCQILRPEWTFGINWVFV